MAPSELELRLSALYRHRSVAPTNSASGAVGAPGAVGGPSVGAPGAAVAVVLAGPQLEVALIRRADDERDPWSGHMALPGGRRDPADADLLATARRETSEEIGVALEPSSYWGALPEVAALSGGRAQGFRVAPFLFRLSDRPEVRPNREVAEVVWFPLSELLGPSRQVDFDFQRGDQVYRFPAWDIDGRVVWGLTHRILSTLLELPERPIVLRGEPPQGRPGPR